MDNGNPKVTISNDYLASMMPTELIYHSLPPMPWFGMDIGGTLSKLVYFEPTDINDDMSITSNGIKRKKADLKTLVNIRRYLTTNQVQISCFFTFLKS